MKFRIPLATAIPLLSLTLLLLLTPALSAQISWQRVDRTAEGPINRAFFWDMTVAPDGTTLVIVGDGIHRIVQEGNGENVKFRAERLDSLRVGWFLESWGGDVLMATDQAIYRSIDNGSSWREAWRWDQVDYPSHMIAVVGDLLVVPSYTRDSTALVGADGSVIRRDTLPRRIRDLQATRSGSLIALSSGNLSNTIYRSVDTGRTWESIPTVWPEGFVGIYSLLVLSDDIFYATSLNGPSLVSYNGGERFDTVRAGDIIPTYIEGERMFGTHVGAPDSVAFVVSEDGGDTWSSCPPANPPGTFMGRDGRRMFSGPVVPHISTTCGEPFRPVESGFRNVEVRRLVEHDGTFWAEMGAGTWRSIDGGLTWEPRDPFFAIDSLGNLYARSDSTGTIIVDGKEEDARYTTLSISSDQGETWRPVFDEPFLSTDERPDFLIRSTADGVVMIRTWTGPAGEPYEADLRTSTDGGATFTPVEGWTTDSRFRPYSIELTADGRIIAVGGRYDPNGQYRDFGVNRRDPVTGEEEWLGGPDFNFLFTGGSGSIYGWKIGTFYRSDDAGESWDSISFPVGIDFPALLVEEAEGYLFVSGGRNPANYLSRDGGKTWEIYDPPTPWDIDPPDIHHSPEGPDMPDAILSDGTIIARIHVDRADSILGTTDYYHYHTLGISTDGARTWTHPLGETLDRKDITAIVWSEEERTLLVGTRDHGLYRAVIPMGVEEMEEMPGGMDLR